MKAFITAQLLEEYHQYLTAEEKSPATIEKYLRDIGAFSKFLNQAEAIDKYTVIAFKEYLKKSYKISSINSILTAVNLFLEWTGHGSCRVKGLKTQKQIFCPEEKELTLSEYKSLLSTAGQKGDRRLALIMQTICSTGIRISELPYITAESLKSQRAAVCCKNKSRTILIPGNLCRLLSRYAKSQQISSGPLFVTQNGSPLNRSYIWSEMKKLSTKAGIIPDKIFPHNLRHLFARTYYQKQKDIAKLADILGHSSIETTRIYTISSGFEHALQLENLGLVMT